MPSDEFFTDAAHYGPGEVLALLAPRQELRPGLYVICGFTGDWTIIRELIDDEMNEQVIVTDRESTLPTVLLQLFVRVGIRIPHGTTTAPYH